MTSRIKLVHYRVDNLNDPKISNVEFGEMFNDVQGNVYYKRHDTGAIVQVTNVNVITSLDWVNITNKPTSFSGFNISLLSSDIPTLDKSKINFGTSNSLNTFGITLSNSDLPNSGVTAGTYTKVTVNSKGIVTNGTSLSSSDIPTLDKSKITFGSSNTLSTFGITLSSSDIPTLDKSKINFGTGNTLSTFGITLSSSDIPTTLTTITFTDPVKCTDAPVAPEDLTRKDWVEAYVDANASAGLKIFDPVKVASTSNLNLASAITNIDGISLVLNDRVLVKDQTTNTENGIYYLTAGNILQRSLDADNNGELDQKSYVFVEQGLTNKASSWVVKDPVTTIGTDPIIWRQFSASTSYTFTNGLSLSGSTVSIANISGLTAGTYTKVTVNTRGQVVSAGSLLEADIPTLSKSKITFGTGNTLSTFGIDINTEINSYSLALASIKNLTLSENKLLSTYDSSGDILFEQIPISTLGKSIIASNSVNDILSTLNVTKSVLETINVVSGFNFTDSQLLKTISIADNGKTLFIQNLDNSLTPNINYDDIKPFIILIDDSVQFPSNFTIRIVNNLKAKVINSDNYIQTTIKIKTASNSNIIYPLNTKLNGYSTLTNLNVFDTVNTTSIGEYIPNTNDSWNTIILNNADSVLLQADSSGNLYIVSEVVQSEITYPVARNSINVSSLNDSFYNYSDGISKFPLDSDIKSYVDNESVINTHGVLNSLGNDNDYNGKLSRASMVNLLQAGTLKTGNTYNGQFNNILVNSNVIKSSVDIDYTVKNLTYPLSQLYTAKPINLSFSQGNKEYFTTLVNGGVTLNHFEWQYVFADYIPNNTVPVRMKVTNTSPKFLSNYDALRELYCTSDLNKTSEYNDLADYEIAMGNLSPFRIGASLVKLHYTTRCYIHFALLRTYNDAGGIYIECNPHVAGLDGQAPTIQQPGLFGNIINTDISNRSLFSLPLAPIDQTALRETKTGNNYSPHLAYSFWFGIDTHEMALKDPSSGKDGLLVLASNASSTTFIILERDLSGGDNYSSTLYEPNKLNFKVAFYNNNVKVAETVAFPLLPLKYVNIIVELKHNSLVKIYVNGVKLSLSVNGILNRPGSIPDLNLPYVSFSKFMYNQNTENPSNTRNHTSTIYFSDYKVLDLSLDQDYSLDQDLNVFMKTGTSTGITMAEMLFREADVHIFNIDTKEWLIHRDSTLSNKKVFLGRTVHTWNDTLKAVMSTPYSPFQKFISNTNLTQNAIFKLNTPTGREVHKAIVRFPTPGIKHYIRFNINIIGKIKYRLYATNHNGVDKMEINNINTSGYINVFEFRSHDLSETAIDLQLYTVDSSLAVNSLLPFKSQEPYYLGRPFQITLEVERDY